MKKYLLDTNVLSEATKPEPDVVALTWLRQHEQEVLVDAIVMAELKLGILLLPQGKKRERLQMWFDELASNMECLPWDSQVSACWAQMVASAQRQGKTLALLDSMMAATALTHELTLVTRNTSDFEGCGVDLLNPFLR